MRELNFDHIVDKEQFNLRLVSLAGVIFLLALTGYLVSSQSYLFLCVLIFTVFSIPSSSLINPKILVYLLVISIPFFAFELFPVNKLIRGWGSVPIHSSHILAVMLIFIVTIRMMLKIGKIKIKVDVIGKMILLLVFVYFISIIGVFQAYQNFTEYFKSIANVLLFVMLYFAFINSITRQDTIRRILKIWIFISLLVALYGIYQLFSHFFSSLPLIPRGAILERQITYQGIPRITSILAEPVAFVLYLVHPLIFMSVLVAEKQMFPFRTLKRNFLALSILLTAFMLSFAVTGYLYLLIFGLLFTLSNLGSSRGNLQKLWLLVLIIFVIVIVSVFTQSGQIFLSRWPRLLTLTDASTRWRVHTLSIAWQEFLKYPLLGIGAGNFPSYTAGGIFPDAVLGRKIYHPDTLVFMILAEMGVVGIIAILLFFGTMLTALQKLIRLNRVKDLNFHISRGLYFMVLTYMISTFVVSGWLEFWVWFNFSIVGTWVLLEGRRLRKV